MYQCHLKLYLVGDSCKVFETIKEMSPLESFTHTFSESRTPEASLTAAADVIVARMQGGAVKELLEELISNKRREADLILLADSGQMEMLFHCLSDIKDVWMMPMSEEEAEFRFLRWQQSCKMSKDLWQTSHYLEATIDNVPNLIWYKTKDGIHEKVNNSFCKTVNKTKEQVQGQGHAYIWDVEQDDPACIESERIVMTKRETCISEEVVQAGDGTKLLTTYKSPLYDLDGSVMGTVGVAIDVTQERAYEREIIAKNQTLETIFTTMDCGIMCHSIDGRRIVSVNRAALEILGYESQEEMEADGFDMIAPTVMKEDKEKLRACIRELKKEGDSVSVEYRVCPREGDIRHVMGNIKIIRENGELLYQRFLLDYTAQKLKETENERRHMELLHALTIDYNQVSYFDLDTGMGMPLREEENADTFSGDVFDGEYSLEESMGRYIDQFVYEEDKEMLRQIMTAERLKRELADKNQSYVNYRVILNGEMKYSQFKIVRAGGWTKSHGVVLGLHSVDEEIRNEMEQKSLLEDALSQANRANKAKSVFLSNMSHDIRTPMNAIVGFTALAITHIDQKERVGEYLNKIMTSGNHLLSLINDVLDMSRIESGKMHLEEKPCRLPDILQGLRNILQADIRAKQLELYMDAVDVLNEDIYCDKLRLNQVLLNLLSNAVKYTTAGGIVSVRVTEKPGAPAGSANYEFRIRDTGVGMSEEFVSHIFEPFEREKNSTTSGIQGTGLGMAITKNIVDMMNGSIEVKSELDSGTEVVVSFTFRLHAEAMKEPQDIPELHNCRALVVDDDFNTCDSVTYMLGQIGMRAEWTLSGKEAILRTRQAISREDTYCVYIIDWLLPDMNGIEVTRRIRMEMGEEVPVIVLTAYDWSEIEEEAKEAGVTAFCSKPMFFSELRSCLHSIVSKGDAKEKEQAGKDTAAQHSHKGRILLAEDNELNQEIAVAILEDAGFSIDVADNGQLAVDMLKKSEPGHYLLVLMDVQMPVMNGYEATRLIRALDNRDLASIPILAMTANAFEEDKQEAARCGMNGHIAKPIDIKNLLNTLEQVLQ